MLPLDFSENGGTEDTEGAEESQEGGGLLPCWGGSPGSSVSISRAPPRGLSQPHGTEPSPAQVRRR